MNGWKPGDSTGKGLSILPEQFAAACGGRSRWAISHTIEEMRNLKKYQYAVASAFAGGSPTVAQKEKCRMRFLPGFPSHNGRLLNAIRIESEMLQNLSLNNARGYPLPMAEIAFPDEQGWLRISYGHSDRHFYGAFDTRLTFNLARPLPRDFPGYDEIFNRPGFPGMECIDRETGIGIGNFTISTICGSGDTVSEYIFESLRHIRKHTQVKRVSDPLMQDIRIIMDAAAPLLGR